MHCVRRSKPVLGPAACAAALLALPLCTAAQPAAGPAQGVAAIPGGVLDPLGMSGHALGASLQGRLRVGDRAVVGAVDYRMDRALLGDEPFRLNQDVTVGPRFAFLPGSTTELFYRYAWSQRADFAAVAGTDADASGAGLAQTWHFLGGDGRLRLEYGVHEGRDIDAPMRAEGQAFSLSGVIPLRWGIDATFVADYRTNAYPDHPGAGDLESVTTAVSAGVNARFGTRLRAGLSFSYADEDFESELLPQRRSAWGIRLRYDP